jgi:hypothetical protein
LATHNTSTKKNKVTMLKAMLLLAQNVLTSGRAGQEPKPS